MRGYRLILFRKGLIPVYVRTFTHDIEAVCVRVRGLMNVLCNWTPRSCELQLQDRGHAELGHVFLLEASRPLPRPMIESVKAGRRVSVSSGDQPFPALCCG